MFHHILYHGCQSQMNINNNYINACKYYKSLLTKAATGDYTIKDEDKDTEKIKKGEI